MPSLQIYDTKGREYSPGGGTGRTNERIKELFYAGVRFAVESVGKTRVTAFFRARETRDARSEQFYAEYTTRNASNLISDFNSALTQRVESEWEYTIDDSSDEMSVFRAIKQNAANVPGSDQDRRVLREMIGSGSIVNVGVRDATNAVGLIQEMAKDCSRAAITDSANTDSLSQFDLAIVTGGYSGIEPLGATEERWGRTEESLRQQFIDEEVGRIEDAVHALSRDHGLSSSEIRSRVTRRVPALKEPSTGSSIASGAGGSGDDGLVTAKMGKFAAIGAVVLLVLIGVVFGAGMVGIGPFAGGGDEIAGDTIQGTVYADADGNETVEGATVRLYNSTTDGELEGETDTDESGIYEFSGLNESTYTVSVSSEEHEYENETNVSPGDSPVDFEPIEAVDSTPSDQNDEARSVLSGVVTESGSDEPLEADLRLTTEAEVTDITSDAEDGSYEFVGVPDGEHVLDVSKAGYESESRDVTVDGDTEANFELVELASYSGQIVDEDGNGVNVANITLSTADGEQVGFEESAPGTGDADKGEFDFGELSAGSYEVIVEKETFETYTEEFELEPGEVREQTIELQQS